MVFTKFAKYQICQISNTKHYLIFELPVPQYSFVMVLIVLIIIIAVLSIHLTNILLDIFVFLNGHMSCK